MLAKFLSQTALEQLMMKNWSVWWPFCFSDTLIWFNKNIITAATSLTHCGLETHMATHKRHLISYPHGGLWDVFSEYLGEMIDSYWDCTLYLYLSDTLRLCHLDICQLVYIIIMVTDGLETNKCQAISTHHDHLTVTTVMHESYYAIVCYMH